MADIMKEVIYAKYLENFPKGLLLYSDNFPLSNERKLSLGLIPKVFPIFCCNSFHSYWKGHLGTSLSCHLDGLGDLLVSYISGFSDFFLATGTASSNSPLVMKILTAGKLEKTNQD